MKKFYSVLLLCILASGCASNDKMSSDDMMTDKKMDTMSSDSMKSMDHDKMKKDDGMGMSDMSDESM